MSDDDPHSSQYAHGHSPTKAVQVRHHVYRSAGREVCELHVTSDEGIHYLFSFKRAQAWSSVRCLTEIISRMSDTKG